MADPWIRVHALLRQKSVTFRAMEALGVKRAAAIGHLVMFWSSVSQCGTNGQVGNCPDTLIEEWGAWEGTRGRFAKFIRENHLDENGRVREWDDYAGVLEDRREKDRQRQRDNRAKKRDSGHVTSDGRPRDVKQTSAPTIRDDTKRDETNQEQERERATSARAPDPEWLAPCRAQWAAKVGPVKPATAKKALSELVKAHGWEAVSRGMADYLVATPLAKAKLEWFAERGTYWVELAKQPMTDPETCEPTDRQRVIVGRPGRAA